MTLGRWQIPRWSSFSEDIWEPKFDWSNRSAIPFAVAAGSMVLGAAIVFTVLFVAVLLKVDEHSGWAVVCSAVVNCSMLANTLYILVRAVRTGSCERMLDNFVKRNRRRTQQ